MFLFNTEPDIKKLKDTKEIGKLIKALKHGEKTIRLQAVKALVELRALSAVETFINILHDINYIQVYFPSANSFRDTLQEITHERDIEPLINLLDGIETFNSSRFAIRSLMGFALGPERNPLLTLLIFREWNVMRIAITKALGEIGADTAIETLINVFEKLSSDLEVYLDVKFPKKAEQLIAQPIVDACTSSSIELRQAIVTTLGKIGDTRAISTLLAAINLDDKTRIAAAMALAEIRHKSAVEPLINLLCSPDFQLREVVAKALGNFNDPRAIEPLIVALHDSELHVGEAAATALGKLGEKAKKHLVVVLNDPDSHVRKLAIETLGVIGGDELIEPLTAALEDSNSQVRKAAGAALAKFDSSKLHLI